jgi:hypothetical protein
MEKTDDGQGGHSILTDINYIYIFVASSPAIGCLFLFCSPGDLS